MKEIAFVSPVKWMRGNLSGRQVLKYNGGRGYSAPSNQKTSADAYQPRLIAKVLRPNTLSRRKYFQVRTRTSVNMTNTNRLNLATMGGACALFAGLLNDKSAPIYTACVQAWEQSGVGYSFRSFMIPLLRAGLAAKDETIVIATGVSIVNPWTSSAEPNVPVPAAIIVKFDSVLGYGNISPYTEAATAALEAAFPDDWETIRQYGLAHPEIVGYMNAYAPEDPKIAYSLVEGIGTRWLIASGGAYINTGVYPDVGSYLHAVGKIISTEDYQYTDMLGCRNGYLNKCYFLSYTYSGQFCNVVINANSQSVALTFNLGQTLDMVIDDVNHKVILNGQEVTISNVAKPSFTMYLFCQNNAGTASVRNTVALSVVEYTGYWWVPFVRKINGVDVCGMIDVLSGTFYQNAGSGSFTISEESNS